MDYVSYAIIVEEISSLCKYRGFVSAMFLGYLAMPNFGTEDQKQNIFLSWLQVKWLDVSPCQSPMQGQMQVTTTYAEDRDHWELNGVKNWITNGVEAGFAIVFAKTTKTQTIEISAFIVETQTPGYSIIKVEEKLGIRKLNYSGCFRQCKNTEGKSIRLLKRF